ncbi:MAG TPA: hypothetical protein VD763_14190 [Candidatus Saccharimonadales bacterium]|nr:hypothetical protein [Candidatus Saccharimonadales bacterium]
MTTDQNDRPASDDQDLDPGAYIGSQPEREAETIPGGVQPGDERIAATNAHVGVDGEPEGSVMDDDTSVPRDSSESSPNTR